MMSLLQAAAMFKGMERDIAALEPATVAHTREWSRRSIRGRKLKG